MKTILLTDPATGGSAETGHVTATNGYRTPNVITAPLCLRITVLRVYPFKDFVERISFTNPAVVI